MTLCSGLLRQALLSALFAVARSQLRLIRPGLTGADCGQDQQQRLAKGTLRGLSTSFHLPLLLRLCCGFPGGLLRLAAVQRRCDYSFVLVLQSAQRTKNLIKGVVSAKSQAILREYALSGSYLRLLHVSSCIFLPNAIASCQHRDCSHFRLLAVAQQVLGQDVW